MAGNEHVRRGYHDLLRNEILELIPKSATKIFDLGCGTGLLGRKLKQRQKCYVAGIELNAEAAKAATQNIDVVFTDNLNRFDPTHSPNRYDCLVLADILEHLIAPWQVLRKFVSVLEDNGVVIGSIPNVAHPYIVAMLSKGLFRYEQAGILDVTHLRFFTKTTIFQLFVKCGLKVTAVRPWPSAENPMQYHITATKPKRPHRDPDTTILILTRDCLAFTKQCIESIKKKTKTAYKILVIDNGSKDGTVEYLRNDPEIVHIENDENHGFARGFNIGLECVDTPYFVLANNDIVVTDGWLERMRDHIDKDNDLVLIGPRSNFVSGPQLIKEIDYKDDETLEAYAKHFKENEAEALLYTHRVVFFCVLMKSVVLQKVGMFDEIFLKGNFEDDDYCMRIRRARLRAAIDNTVFIHHYGSKTFAHSNIDYNKIMAENKAKFTAKWATQIKEWGLNYGN